MKKHIKKYTPHKVGVIAQVAVISSLFTLEIIWGALAQQDLLRGLYCLFFFLIFAVIMFDLYIMNSRNTVLRTNGPFALSRHPVYVCLFMISLSYWFSNPSNFVLIFLLQIVLWSGLLIASLMQEKVILKKYGKSAEEYYKNTPRFIFF